jgi:hypothetical protein
MNLENQLLEKFQVEELEKRYEFAWVDEVKITGSYEVVPGGTITASTTIQLN